MSEVKYKYGKHIAIQYPFKKTNVHYDQLTLLNGTAPLAIQWQIRGTGYIRCDPHAKSGIHTTETSTF